MGPLCTTVNFTFNQNRDWLLREPLQSIVDALARKGGNMHSSDHHCISSGKMSVTKPVKMASSSNTKAINENKFQPASNAFCGWRSQGNYNCNLCLLLFLSHIFAIQGQVNSLLREWSAAREPCISKVGPSELPQRCFPFQQQQDRDPEFIPTL